MSISSPANGKIIQNPKALKAKAVRVDSTQRLE
jgi:hypothetical protein